MKKKVLAMLLSMAMCASFMSIPVSASVYVINVNGKSLKSDRLTVECGGGTATYDPAKKELTLNNATLTREIYNSLQELTIVLVGDNAINIDSSTNRIGIESTRKITLIGDGSLDITVDSDNNAIESSGDICLDMNGDLTITDSKQGGIYSDGNIEISGSSNIIIDSYNVGIKAENDIAISDDVDLNITTASDESYGIYSRYGEVSFNEKGDLYIDSKGYGIYSMSSNFNLAADGTITVNSNNKSINTEHGDIDISGNGKIVVNTLNSGICGRNIELSNVGDIELNVKYWGIYAEINCNITDSSSGNITISNAEEGIFAGAHNATISGSGDINITMSDDSDYGIYAGKACNITASSSGNITISNAAKAISSGSGSVNLSNSGNITISDNRDIAIYAPDGMVYSGSGDINIKDSLYAIYSGGEVTLSGSGDFIASVNNNGIRVPYNDLVLSGTGKVDVTSQFGSAVYLGGTAAEVLLNGKNDEVKFTAFGGRTAVCNEDGLSPVAGDNIGKYDVEGAPNESSVKYTLRTYDVTFDMGGHGTAPENQAVMEEDTAVKPENPTADGWSFEGWYSDKECKNAFDFATAITEDTILYAKWTCLHKNTEVKDAKDASLTEKGYTGDTYCKDCGELIKKGEEIPTLTPEPSGDPTPSPKPSGEPTPTNEPTPTPKPSGEPTPTVPPTTPTPASELDVGDFVDRCYEVALGREADEDGYYYWKNQLTNGEACGAQAGFGFIFSSEYANKNTTNEQFVTDMYSMFFGREADEAGYNYWLEQLNAGTATREQVFAGFANSEEFYNLCNKYGVVSGYYAVGVPNDQQGGVNCFVARLYKVCLNRLPDQGGQSGWVMKLMNGEVSGSSCAYGFVFSPEFVNMNLDNVNFVNYMYKAFFGREADQDGLNYWVEQLNAGTATREDIFAGFSGSAEFANLCASYGINA